MSRSTTHHRRTGATAVEFAVACPIAFFIVFAIIVGGLGIFRYQQVASAAREGARWASVHGGLYEDETDQPAATPQDIYNNAIVPAASSLSPNYLTYQVENDYEHPIGNTVTVTVTYQWFPEMYLVGPFSLTSTSTTQMAY
jgi:Flp pilus assembly protein TadG